MGCEKCYIFTLFNVWYVLLVAGFSLDIIFCSNFPLHPKCHILLRKCGIGKLVYIVGKPNSFRN